VIASVLASYACAVCAACGGGTGAGAASPGASTSATTSATTNDLRPGERVVLEDVLYTAPVTALVGFATAPVSDVSPSELSSIGVAAESDFEDNYRNDKHTRWFFYAFDASMLTFVLADYAPKDVPPGVLGSHGSYVARRRYRCERTAETEAMFEGVQDTLRQWEVGIGGVRAGTKLTDVIAAKGPPAHVEPTQIMGWDHVDYPDVHLFVAHGVVRSVSAP
jgi:hypothetical protein